MRELTGPQPAPPCGDGEFLEEVLHGLSLPQKSIPCRFLYDRRGSELFERIAGLPEYYPTRTEIVLLKDLGPILKETAPSGAAVVEFGSGSSVKTGFLLEALDRPAAYIPIDISAAALYPAAARIRERFPGIAVHPIPGSFHDPGKLKLPFPQCPRLGFFPGSTIGNLTPAEAASFLRSARRFLGGGSLFVIGVDLQKPLEILLPAYDDAQGVTAAFNRNVLVRINSELGGTFDPELFQHRPLYNAAESRIEMHLRAPRAHRVRVAGRSFDFGEGETIHTENSYKYSISGFQALARAGGWTPLTCWTDKDNLFSLHILA